MDQSLPSGLDPAQVKDKALQSQVDQMTQRGELRFTNWASSARPADGWNLDAFNTHMETNTPSTPPFSGAQTPQSWVQMARPAIGGAEGNESFAYHGSLTKERAAGKFRTSEGDDVSQEVAVGYGFNLTQKGGRELYDGAMAGKGPSYDDVLYGRKPLDTGQADQLRDFMIYQKNAILERQLAGTPLADRQRAALVSMLYQGADTKPAVAAIKAGQPDTAVADIIRRSTLGPKNVFQNRRNHEAALFLASQSERYFADNGSNQLPSRPTNAAQP